MSDRHFPTIPMSAPQAVALPQQQAVDSKNPLIRPDLLQATVHIWIVLAAVAYVYDLLRQTADGLTNGIRRPFGDDFINYWSAPQLAWQNRAAEIYDFDAFHAFQVALVGPKLDLYHYSYPPVLLVLTAPLVLLPYIPGLFAWLTAGWYAFYRALRVAMPGRNALVLSLAAPGLFINACSGQNGTWTAALLGGGLAVLSRRPVLAGILFGLLICKPHLGLLLPIALLAGRQWRAIAAASVTAVVLVLASVALFGIELWNDYFRQASILRQAMLEEDMSHRMVSVFIALRKLGADVPLAYLIQACVALPVAAAVAVAWWRDVPENLRNALLIVGTCLAVPYVQDYDLVMGAFVAAWLTDREAVPRAFHAQVLIAVGLLLTLPFWSGMFAISTGVSIAPLVIIVPLVVTARVILAQQSGRYRPVPIS
jgi:arabinofuranan 3-O-arabinosyltransferase